MEHTIRVSLVTVEGILIDDFSATVNLGIVYAASSRQRGNLNNALDNATASAIRDLIENHYQTED